MSKANFLSDISQLEPSLVEYEPDQMELDRFGEVATIELSKCHGIDLLTNVWRGRIIATAQTIYASRNALSQYGTWLKANSLTEQLANESIQTAVAIDDLFNRGKLTISGIGNISYPAFKSVLSLGGATPAVSFVEQVASLAESGARVDINTVKHLSSLNAIESSESLSPSVKDSVKDGNLPVVKTAKLVKLIKQLENISEAAETVEDACQKLFQKPSINNLKDCTKEIDSVAKFWNSASQIAGFCPLELEFERLFEEAERLGLTDELAKICTELVKIEKNALNLYKRYQKLTELCDYVFVNSGAADLNLRKIADSYGSHNQSICVPQDNSAIRFFIEAIELDNSKLEQQGEN